MSAAAALAAEGLAVGYRGRRRRSRVVLAGLDLALPAGALTCLLGPNGSGKSTLLRTLAGMQPPLAGRACLGGDDVVALEPRERARRLAVVLTDQVDSGLLTAGDLVALGRFPYTTWDGRLGASDRAAVAWALAATGAAPLAGRRVDELSDGERQRVLIARALAQQPAVLALDEPVAFVDVPRRLELLRLLRDLAHECGLAVLLTTHDLDLALHTADILWLVEPAKGEVEVEGSDGAGACVHVGAPEDLALSGVIGRAFAGDGVTFDPLRGTVVADTVPLASVHVAGDGPPAIWAARGLEREGLAVIDGDARLRVTAAASGWTLEGPQPTSSHDTIAGLLSAVRAALPDLAAPHPHAPSGR